MRTNIQSMKIGPVIREIREAQKATLEEIAFVANTAASNLSRSERGAQGYSPEMLERIALALGTTVSELHRRAEATAKQTGKVGGSAGSRKRLLAPVALAASKYSTLTPENRDLADEFMALLLRRQRQVKS